jgi:hypothetical protein
LQQSIHFKEEGGFMSTVNWTLVVNSPTQEECYTLYGDDMNEHDSATLIVVTADGETVEVYRNGEPTTQPVPMYTGAVVDGIGTVCLSARRYSD